MEGSRNIFATDFQQSLTYYLLHGLTPNQDFYSCSNKTVAEWYLTGQTRPILGTYFLTTGIILITLYLPCIVVIAKSDLMKSSCYKIMLYLSFLDICCLCTNSLATGYLGLTGGVFCTNPRFIYFMGAIGCGCWMGSCCTCVILALNRCCDINDQLKIRFLFIGKNVYIALAIPIVYTIYSIFFTKPILFNSNYMSWFLNPYTGQQEPEHYINVSHTINNCVVSFCTTTLYGYLCILLFAKNKHAQSSALSKTQKQIFTQSILICSYNAIAAYIYVYMQFFPSPEIVIIIGQIAWQFSHGSVGVIYLTMNRTVRSNVVNLILPQIMRKKLKIGGVGQVTKQVTTVGGKVKTATSSGAVF